MLNSENEAAYRIEAYQAVRNAQGGKVEGNIIIDLAHITENEILSRQVALRALHPKISKSELDEAVSDEYGEVSDFKKALASEPSWVR